MLALSSVLNHPGFQISAVLWDDPLLGLFHDMAFPVDCGITWPAVIGRLDGLPRDAAIDDARPASIARRMAELLSMKLVARQTLADAYRSGDAAALRGAAKQLLGVADAVVRWAGAFRVRWLATRKPKGLEVMQIRLAGLAERHREAARRIDELLAGSRDRIEELDEPAPPARGFQGTYRVLATPSVVF